MQTTLGNKVTKIAKLGWLFYACVVLPTIISFLYFVIFASDVYISEARFIVRSPNKPETTGFGVLLKTVGFSNAGDEIFAANDYLISRDALKELNTDDAVGKSYRNPDVSVFNRFDPIGYDSSFDDLYQYFKSKVSVEYDSSTSITTLRVKAYNALDAHKFSEALLEQAEALVNRLNVQARNDLLETSRNEVEQAREQARSATQALAGFRDRSGIVDPEKQAEVQIQMVSKLQDQLIAARIRLDQVRSLASQSSEIEPLQSQIAGLQASINQEISRAAGGKASLSRAAIEYQRLIFDEQFAQKKLAATLTSLEAARIDAQNKQAYVERIVQPSLPDEAQEPRRLRGVIATLVMGMIVWGLLSMLLASFRDHVE